MDEEGLIKDIIILARLSAFVISNLMQNLFVVTVLHLNGSKEISFAVSGTIYNFLSEGFYFSAYMTK